MRIRVLTLLAALALVTTLLPSTVSGSVGTAQTYIVLYSTTSAVPGGAATAIRGAGGSVVASYPAIGVVVARSSDPDFAPRLRASTGVEGAASTAAFGVRLALPEAGPASSADPVDDTGEPLWPLQWDMAQINLAAAHAVTGGSPSVTVGDIDTGVDWSHPDLVPNLDFSKSVSCESGAPDTDPAAWLDHFGHGTHTAGTIAAAANGQGIVGVAPNVKLAAIKSGNDDGFLFPEMVLCSFMWAATHDIQVTNNSYFVDPWLFNCQNDPEQRAIWKALQRAIGYAIQQGVTVVASAGNFSDDLAHPTQDVISPDTGPGEVRAISNACKVIPVEVPGVVGVSATGPTTMKSFYSNYGSGVVDVAAPGGDSLNIDGTANGRVLSTWPSYLPCGRLVVDNGARYCYLQGTSMAAPHVAGVAALIKSMHPNDTPGQVASLLGVTAVPTACPTDLSFYAPFPSTSNDAPQTCSGGTTNSWYGHGIVDAYNAVTR